MVEAEGNFSQVKMEELFRHPAVVVEPMLGVTPEAFYPVDVVAPFGSPALLPDDDVRAAPREPGVSLPIVGLVEASRSRVFDHEPLDSAPPAPLNREGPHDAVALEDAEHDHLPGGTPPSFALAMAAEHRLVALNGSGEWLSAFLGNADDVPDDAEELLGGRARDGAAEAQPVSRHPEHEVVEQLELGALREPQRIPRETERVAVATATALESAVDQRPRPMMPAVRTGSTHRARMLLKLVRFR